MKTQRSLAKRSLAKRVRAVALAFLLTAPLAAQFETAAVVGVVRDPSGEVIPAARVKLENIATGIANEASTNAEGLYLFQNVRVGVYQVSAASPGFKTAVTDEVRVVVGARQRVDFALELGEVTETIEVVGAASLVESESSDRGQIISSKQIVELPLNGRNYSDLALLATGVRRSDYAFANPPREGSFNINGQRSIFNNFMLDGVDNNAYGTSNQGFSNQVVQMTPDAVAEFKVVTGVPGAEYGRSPGGVINASMKSGTNEIHGSAWNFLRNTALNADGFFRPATGKPVFQRNQFGFTLGGPIKKNKAFFFTNYEGFRERQKFTVFSSLPTLSDRAGQFDLPVRNPLTDAVYAPGQIPQTAITPFARQVLSDLPAPNTGGPTQRGSNFQTLRSDRNNNDKMDVKLDGQPNGRTTAFIRVSHRKSNIFQDPSIPGPSGGGGNGFIRALNQQIAGAVTYAPTPRSLIEFRMGLSNTEAGKEPPGLGGPGMFDLYGIPGLPDDPQIRGGLTPQDITGFSGLGRQATNPQWQHPFVYNPKVNLSWFLGKHSIKTGYEYQRIHTEIQDVNPLVGRDVYNGRFSLVPGSPAPTAAQNATYNLADFMFGARSEYQLVNFYVADYRQVMNYAYIQDDWKVSRNLTLNLGMRYEYATPQWDANMRLSNFDPVSNQLIPARDGSIAERAQVNPDRNNFAPRIGFAYSMDPRTVVRGGYGIAYAHFNRAGGGNILGINGPQVVIAAIAQQPDAPGLRPTQDGYPVGLTNPENFDPLRANISYIPRDTRTAYVQTWTMSVQRQVGKNGLIDIGYVGNNSTNLILFADFNQARPNMPGQNLPIQARRPNQDFAAITVTWPGARANYHALQAKFEQRYQNGLYLLSSFVYSKAIDTVGQALEAQGTGGRASPQSFFDIAAERAVSDFDQTLNSTTSLVWEVPVGRGRRFGSSMPLLGEYVLGGWQVSGINSMWSGQPLNLSYNPPAAFQVSQTLPDWRGGISYRPNLVGPAQTPKATRTIDNFLNPDNVVIPNDPSRPFGNAGRNVARSYPLYQFDVGVSKSFPMPREGMELQFRTEAFNLLNRTNFRNAIANRSAAGFGQVRSTFPARQVQFALRLVF